MGEAQTVANWLNGDVSGWLNANELEIQHSKLTPENFSSLIALIDAGTISGKIAKDLLPDIMQGANPAQLVKDRGLEQTTDVGAIEAAILTVMNASPDVVENAKKNPKAINALFGPIMKVLGGKAKPDLVRELLNKALGLS